MNGMQFVVREATRTSLVPDPVEMDKIEVRRIVYKNVRDEDDTYYEPVSDLTEVSTANDFEKGVIELTAKGYSATRIAAELHVPYKRVQDYRRMLADRIGTKALRLPRYSSKVPMELRAKLVQAYQEGMAMGKIAERYGVTRQAVYYAAKATGVLRPSKRKPIWVKKA